MKDNGTVLKETVTEFLLNVTVTILKDIGLMTQEKVRAPTSTTIRINSLLVSG